MSDPGQGRVLRSQSRLLREVQDTISVAPKKPRVVEPSSSDPRIQGSARKLFASSSNSTSSHPLYADGDENHPLHYEGDEDIELDDVEDTSATPRASFAAGGSVFDHFVPNPELFQGIAGVAVSGAARVANAVTNSLLPDFGRPVDPPGRTAGVLSERPAKPPLDRPSRPVDRSTRPSVERPTIERPTVERPVVDRLQRPLRTMATRLPASSRKMWVCAVCVRTHRAHEAHREGIV